MWKNEYLIYLRVRDGPELEYWKWKLEQAGRVIASFQEPDINNELTAIAVVDDGNSFDKLRML